MFMELLIIAIVFLGWLFPLCLGVRWMNRGSRGTALAVLGMVWGWISVLLLASATRLRGDSSAWVIHQITRSAWLVPFGVGILFLRRGLRGSGVVITFAGLWAVLGIGLYVNDAICRSGDAPYVAQVLVTERNMPVRSTAGMPNIVAQTSDVSLSMQITGLSGRDHSLLEFQNPFHTPGFKVLSRSGEVLWQGKFAYG